MIIFLDFPQSNLGPISEIWGTVPSRLMSVECYNCQTIIDGDILV